MTKKEWNQHEAQLSRCKKCGEHFWFEPCYFQTKQGSFVLQMIRERDPELLERA